ncbi:MAG TPA: FmdB family zinc ribbon protein [Steroidobacteraceae bacterium]
MPFYEYECSHCRYYLEVMQKISDAPLKKCPSCGKKGLRKLMSAPVFRLKGSGWYETDFKSDQEHKRNLAGGDKDEPAAVPKETKEPDGKAAATESAGAGETKGEAAAGGKAAESKAAEGKAAEGKAAESRAAEGKAAKGETREPAATPAAGRGRSRPSAPATTGRTARSSRPAKPVKSTRVVKSTPRPASRRTRSAGRRGRR